MHVEFSHWNFMQRNTNQCFFEWTLCLDFFACSQSYSSKKLLTMLLLYIARTWTFQKQTPSATVRISRALQNIVTTILLGYYSLQYKIDKLMKRSCDKIANVNVGKRVLHTLFIAFTRIFQMFLYKFVHNIYTFLSYEYDNPWVLTFHISHHF